MVKFSVRVRNAKEKLMEDSYMLMWSEEPLGDEKIVQHRHLGRVLPKPVNLSNIQDSLR